MGPKAHHGAGRRQASWWGARVRAKGLEMQTVLSKALLHQWPGHGQVPLELLQASTGLLRGRIRRASKALSPGADVTGTEVSRLLTS